MKLDAVGVTTSDKTKTIEFYTLLGFDFSEVDIAADHIEPRTSKGSARLMIDSKTIISDIIDDDPKPGNHSSFAIRYVTPEEVNTTASKIEEAGFRVIEGPWDAFWGQRYAIVEDPDGYKVDLYANLESEISKS